MTEREIRSVLHRKHRDRDPERYRRRCRKSKLRRRYRDRLDQEIGETAEKLAMLRAIKAESR